MIDRTPGIAAAHWKPEDEYAASLGNGRRRIMEMGIAVEPIAEAFERSGLSKGEVARRLGWFKPNTDRLTKTLGGSFVRYSTALEICEALGLDPVDLGL